MTTPRLTLLGATGRVGSLVAHEALRDGLTVTALVRDRARLAPDLLGRPGLQVVVGEIDDLTAMTRAVTDSDVVICTLGVRYRKSHPWGGIQGRPDVVPATVATLLAAVRATAQPRPRDIHVVLLSAFGAGESWPQLPGIARAVISSSALRESYRALTQGEHLLRTGGQPHTIVRAVSLTDQPGTGRSVDATGLRLRGNPKVSREDVARLLLDLALDNTSAEPHPVGPAGATRDRTTATIRVAAPLPRALEAAPR